MLVLLVADARAKGQRLASLGSGLTPSPLWKARIDSSVDWLALCFEDCQLFWCISMLPHVCRSAILHRVEKVCGNPLQSNENKGYRNIYS